MWPLLRSPLSLFLQCYLLLQQQQIRIQGLALDYSLTDKSSQLDNTTSLQLPRPQAYNVPNVAMTIYFGSFGERAAFLDGEALFHTSRSELSQELASHSQHDVLDGGYWIAEEPPLELTVKKVDRRPLPFPVPAEPFTYQDLQHLVTGLSGFFPTGAATPRVQNFYTCTFDVIKRRQGLEVKIGSGSIYRLYKDSPSQNETSLEGVAPSR